MSSTRGHVLQMTRTDILISQVFLQKELNEYAVKVLVSK